MEFQTFIKFISGEVLKTYTNALSALSISLSPLFVIELKVTDLHAKKSPKT